MRYRNIGARRVWPTLVDESTGRTLELDAGDEVELSDELADPYLAPASADAGDPGPDSAPTPEQAAREVHLRDEIAADQAALGYVHMPPATPAGDGEKE
jgi:hypothetical protein